MLRLFVYKISFRDVSLVPSVAESDIERHLQAENMLLCESFVLEHQNYVHYGAFEHADLTGYVFSTIHSD